MRAAPAAQSVVWWRNPGVRSVLLQAFVLALVAFAIIWLADNTAQNLAKRGITVGFEFLGRSARFPISESILPYRPADSFLWALLVGFGNTLFLSFNACVGATLLGFVLALGRRSTNLLAYGFSGAIVDLLRNSPLVVQLLFWYALITVGLPDVHVAMRLPGDVVLSNRGLYLPALTMSGAPASAGAGWALIIGGAAAALLLRRRGRLAAATGALLALAGVAAWVAGHNAFAIDRPELGAYNFDGGFRVTPEFAALSVGLLLYSSAFVCEIVRGGIDAVPKGQWEAGRALGLSEHSTLWTIVMPQAMRVIIPPMTTQYVSIIKNTTLALVVGYPEISLVTATTINQTGQALEGTALLLGVFLVISLSASLLMSLLNRRMAVKTR